MADQRTILITGATGRQGGAVLRALSGSGFALRALTRNPDSDAAKALAAGGVEVIKGDFDDPASLKPALAGAWGTLSIQNTWEAGVKKEEEQGKRLAQLAREAGVQHFVYHSVASAHRRTGIPHFENKARIEDTVRQLQFPSHVIIRPVFFMENLLTPGFLREDKLSAALKPTTRLQMIAVRDIGQYGARAFTDAERLNRREIDIAGDEVTMPDAAAALSAGLGRPVEFVEIPIAEIRKVSEDYGTMLEWFERVGYNVNIPALVRDFGIQPTTLATWMKAHAAAR
jgi:uncharacterized protein YbjT (DUF2867 family)